MAELVTGEPLGLEKGLEGSSAMLHLRPVSNLHSTDIFPWRGGAALCPPRCSATSLDSSLHSEPHQPSKPIKFPGIFKPFP